MFGSIVKTGKKKVIFVLAVVILIIGSCAKDEHKEYRQDASATLAELEKLSAKLEVGITYMEYKDRLGDINYYVSTFLDKYDNYNSLESQVTVYEAIQDIMRLYLDSAELWKWQIQSIRTYDDSGWEDLRETANEHLENGWGIIALQIKLARRILEEDNEERRQRFIVEFTDAQNLWTEQVRDFRHEIDDYLELRRTKRDRPPIKVIEP